MNKRTVGSVWEEAAAGYLTGIGYKIIEKNFRSREGEIDLVAIEGGYLVFVEVRYRSSVRKGHPLETITIAKQRKICRVSRYYLMKNQISDDTPVRYDVVAVLGNQIEVVKDAFSYQL